MNIVKTYVEKMPKLKLIGKRYTKVDEGKKTFGAQWCEWHKNNWFSKLTGLKPAYFNHDSYHGAMRIKNGVFEYWIGLLFDMNTQAPEGFESVDIGPITMYTLWLYGDENNGELYGEGVHQACLAEVQRRGYRLDNDCWTFERYNCPRFTNPDQKGNVILDYCIAVQR